jgi:restriction endonuclease Mrr
LADCVLNPPSFGDRVARCEAACARLVLIDGEEFAGLMVDYEVGVTVREVLKLASVDGDYFEDE